jgi:Flp pilus assembly protein CpaB
MSNPSRSCGFIRLRKLVALLTGFWGAAGAISLGWYDYQSGVMIPVPQKDLSAYHLIQTEDLTQQQFPQDRISTSVVRDSQGIVGHYTLIKVSHGQPISSDQLIAGDRLKDHRMIGISATSAMTFGAHLQTGDLIDLTLVPAKSESTASPSPISFKDILGRVLKLQP